LVGIFYDDQTVEISPMFDVKDFWDDVPSQTPI
jgi:hypothetical protein